MKKDLRRKLSAIYHEPCQNLPPNLPDGCTNKNGPRHGDLLDQVQSTRFGNCSGHGHRHSSRRKYFRRSKAWLISLVAVRECQGPHAIVSAKLRMPCATNIYRRYFPSAVDATKYLYHTEGLRGFWVGECALPPVTANTDWKGTWAPLASLTITRTLTFSIYRRAKYGLDSMIESITGSSPLQHVNKMGTYPNLSTVLCFTGSGMIAGGFLAPFLSKLA